MLLPDYAGPACATWCPTLLESPEAWPDWFPSAAAEADQVLLLVLDGLGWEQLRRAGRRRRPTWSAMAGGPILTVAPVDHVDGADLAHDRSDPRRARRHRLPHRHRRRGAQRAALVGRRARRRGDHPAREAPAGAGRSSATGHRSSPRADFRASGLHAGAPRRRALPRLPGDRRPWSSRPAPAAVGRAVRVRLLRRHRQGRPRVRPGRALRRRARPTSTAWSATWPPASRPAPRWWSPPTTVRSTSGDDMVDLHRDVLDQVSFQSGEGRFRWLHARPGRAERAARGRSRAPRRPGLGGRLATQLIDDGWFGPDRHRRGPATARRRRPVAEGTLAFFDPDDSGPFELIARHGSLTPAEMRVPLLAVSGVTPPSRRPDTVRAGGRQSRS